MKIVGSIEEDISHDFFGEMVIDGINLWILLLLSDIIIVRRTKQVLHDDFTIRRNT